MGVTNLFTPRASTTQLGVEQVSHTQVGSSLGLCAVPLVFFLFPLNTVKRPRYRNLESLLSGGMHRAKKKKHSCWSSLDFCWLCIAAAYQINVEMWRRWCRKSFDSVHAPPLRPWPTKIQISEQGRRKCGVWRLLSSSHVLVRYSFSRCKLAWRRLN